MLPPQLIRSLEKLESFDKEAFEKVHASGEQITSIRLNPMKWVTPLTTHDSRFTTQEKIPWTDHGYYLETRPSFTFDPLFHAGCYYVQEASSMFLEQALKQTVDLSRSLKVLDLSAAPGGKSTHIQSLISKDSLLVCNDVIRSRANVLKDNIIKWGSQNVVVTHNDPRDFTSLENYFDVIVVDAPCSGSGLFRREPEAINEWSENNVQLCSQRQKRILADVWPALKKDGILIYSTCSYSKEENEDIADWMENNLSRRSEAGRDADQSVGTYCPLAIDKNWGITGSEKGYRFWPYKVKGEGLFISVFQKKDGESEGSFHKRATPGIATKKEKQLLEEWVKTAGIEFIKHENTVYAWPQQLLSDFSFLLHHLRVIYSGTRVGELIRDKLIPDHALAMSPLIRETVPRVELDREQAIEFLQRKELKIDTPRKGWQLVEYLGHPLGWINVLANRINNYYPREMRILKDN